jgi:hypothetical protein
MAPIWKDKVVFAPGTRGFIGLLVFLFAIGGAGIGPMAAGAPIGAIIGWFVGAGVGIIVSLLLVALCRRRFKMANKAQESAFFGALAKALGILILGLLLAPVAAAGRGVGAAIRKQATEDPLGFWIPFGIVAFFVLRGAYGTIRTAVHIASNASGAHEHPALAESQTGISERPLSSNP